MVQPSVASFFNTRKRAANIDDIANIKNKYAVQDRESPSSQIGSKRDKIFDDDKSSAANTSGLRTRSGRVVKRSHTQATVDVVPKKVSKVVNSSSHSKSNNDKQQTLLVPFVRKGPMTPRKRQATKDSIAANNDEPTQTALGHVNSDIDHVTKEIQRSNEETPCPAKNSARESDDLSKDCGFKTPTKQIIKGSGAEDISGGAKIRTSDIKSLVRKELNFDEVKGKITRSAKLKQLKDSLNRIQELEKKRKEQEERNRRLREGLKPTTSSKAPVVQLKEFDTIEVEVLTSPAKGFKTPTKLLPKTPDKNELMSPRHTDVSKRVLFSPSKDGSPSKMVMPPAYQRFMSLVQTSKAGQLTLPYKHRHLIEIFKAVDAMCAMFHNRKECITFKKLKPAVQRMLRKNFSETHLAQIKHIYPEAFLFTQMKMRNYGSTSKADYFQLVIMPNVEGGSKHQLQQRQMQYIDEDNVLDIAQTKIMNPQTMTERLQRFQNLLLERVKTEHEEFLKTLDPPLLVSKDKVMRWHPDFDLENCKDIECAHLPQPPNVEKYSSARDILSTARNLFNCATPMERALERYEAKIEAERLLAENSRNRRIEQSDAPKQAAKGTGATSDSSKPTAAATTTTTSSYTKAAADNTATLLKGLPQSLVDKIRAKQAAKALDSMCRRPSQDRETIKYSRLPDLARHLRNVFITEKKSVLHLEIVIKKIQNSFRTCLSPQEIEDHLRLMAKELPLWIAFHEVRKTMYVKISKDMDLAKIIAKLEAVANEKSK